MSRRLEIICLLVVSALEMKCAMGRAPADGIPAWERGLCGGALLVTGSPGLFLDAARAPTPRPACAGPCGICPQGAADAGPLPSPSPRSRCPGSRCFRAEWAGDSHLASLARSLALSSQFPKLQSK